MKKGLFLFEPLPYIWGSATCFGLQTGVRRQGEHANWSLALPRLPTKNKKQKDMPKAQNHLGSCHAEQISCSLKPTCWIASQDTNVPGADGAGEVGPGSGEARLPAAQGERRRPDQGGTQGGTRVAVWFGVTPFLVLKLRTAILSLLFFLLGGRTTTFLFCVCVSFLGGSLQKRRGTPFPGFFLRGSRKRNPHPWERKLRLRREPSLLKNEETCSKPEMKARGQSHGEKWVRPSSFHLS